MLEVIELGGKEDVEDKVVAAVLELVDAAPH